MSSIDLNADLGEGVGDDEAMLGIVSSASIACGGHAGNEATMRVALRAAKARGVVVGAHPSFPDRENFGRKRMVMAREDLEDSVLQQVRMLRDLGEREGRPVRYVKLHGALANLAAEDVDVARTCFAGLRAIEDELAVLAIDNSAQVEAVEGLGLRAIREAYADRAYLPNGLLVPRVHPGAVLHDPDAIARRAVRLAETGEIVSIDGTVIRSRAQSLCIHGDTPDAVAIARAVKAALGAAGVEIRAVI